MHADLGAIQRSPAKVFVHNLPRRQIVRERVPHAVAPQHLRNTLEHLPQVQGPRPSAGLGRGQQSRQPFPLCVGYVAGVSCLCHT